MIGAEIGHYKLVAEIGKGGFGRVYRGVHRELPTLQVAVKVFDPDLARDPVFSEFLARECEILSGLHHPGIVGFRDLVVSREAIAIVMELLSGCTLREVMRRGPVPVQEVLRITRETLDALAYAHRRGVVHRDIKPENIFLGQVTASTTILGPVRIMDFGISKVLSETQTTRSQVLSGTIDYMAPELKAGGQAGLLDILD